jgi:ABC-2 type transport system permease protein
MKTVYHILIKELKIYFQTPVAYVVYAIFLGATGLLFWIVVTYTREASMRETLADMAIIILVSSPILTMKLFAEEQQTGTIELLLTLPIHDWQLVLAKYLAGVTVFAGMLLSTLVYPALLLYLGKPDVGTIWVGYLGIFLVGAAFTSVGLFTSSLTKNQIASALLSFAILLIFWFSRSVSSLIGPPFSRAFRYLAIPEHYGDFLKGVLDSSHVVFFVILIVLFLFLSLRSVSSRRWR